ncbi:MAG: 2-phospho-L-lactate transferase CofD family protein, partial [Candidatus Amesbacteria bacterium]|nr:2-phospho-L-lactate transferase CofD family protein [Candidatus Amesbacteria bacterium]
MKVVTIGGGTGAPIIIKALIGAGVTNITAICAAMDSGGKTGIIRSDERDRVIAISDLLRNLLTMIPQNHTAFAEMLNFVDGRNRNLGYTIYYALLEKYNNNFLAVQQHFEHLLGIKFLGQVIPVSLEPTNIKFQTESGEIWVGEHELDRQAMSANNISKFWIDPVVTATPEAIKAIKTANVIIYAPGSLYGSILVNFLPLGIKQVLKTAKAKKILITNLTSNRNQTHEFTPPSYWKLFQKYTGLKRPFDIIISPNLTRSEFDKKFPKVSLAYDREHAHFLGWEEK